MSPLRAVQCTWNPVVVFDFSFTCIASLLTLSGDCSLATTIPSECLEICLLKGGSRTVKGHPQLPS